MRDMVEEFKKLHKFYIYTEHYQTKDLAEFMGVNARTIDRYMSGKTKPSQARLRQIQAYLDMKTGMFQGLKAVNASIAPERIGLSLDRCSLS